jgi:hypothetical protein
MSSPLCYGWCQPRMLQTLAFAELFAPGVLHPKTPDIALSGSSGIGHCLLTFLRKARYCSSKTWKAARPIKSLSARSLRLRSMTGEEDNQRLPRPDRALCGDRLHLLPIEILLVLHNVLVDGIDYEAHPVAFPLQCPHQIGEEDMRRCTRLG